MSILQRITYYDWSKEFYIFLSITTFVVIHHFALNSNKKKVFSWIKNIQPILEKEFSQVGVSPDPTHPLIATYNPTTYSTYATGREVISSFNVDFTLIGKHNPITLIMEYVLGFFFAIDPPKESIRVIITPSKTSGVAPCVFAIVNKNEMKASRDDNYFLSLTKTSDSSKLPVSFVFMSESSELTESLFSSELAGAIGKSQNILKYFALADQPKDRPTKIEDTLPRPRLILSLNFPKSNEDVEASIELIQASINFIDDSVTKTHVRPEVFKKIKATRETELKKVQKALDEIKAEELAKKKAEEKRTQRNKISKLSPAEQKRIEQKEREKEMRKLRHKQTKRL